MTNRYEDALENKTAGSDTQDEIKKYLLGRSALARMD
jgi:hypothetical protein